MAEQVQKIVLSVILVNGTTKEHTYIAPLTKADFAKFIDFQISMFTVAVMKNVFFFFSNPSIMYNPRNVIGVEIRGVTREEIDKAMQSVHRKRMGFVQK